MCRKVALFILVLLAFCEVASATQFAYQVNFTDKNGTVPFADSSLFLSARSLARRHAQGIALDSTDLPVKRAYVDSVLTLTGGTLHCVSKWLNLCVVLVTDSNQIHALAGKPYISGIKLVGYYDVGILHDKPARTAGKATLDATYYGETWGQTALVNGQYLHGLGYKGSGLLIAVVDQGFAGVDTHPGFDSMHAAGRLIDVHNFALDTTYVFGYSNHGTEVFSTIAGYMPGTFVGSAPLASYALYITEASGEKPIELINLLCGAERADSIGADIISSSLGYNFFDDAMYEAMPFATYFDGHTTIAAKAANLATRKGMLFVTSAGNDGADRILTPGDSDSALTIGSVDAGGTVAPSSGIGPNALGVIKPDVCGMGVSAAVFSSGGGIGYVSGTSLATPEIAGFAACLWQASPSATPAMIRHAIQQCASQYTTPGNQIGYGVANFQCAATALNIKDTPVPAGADLLSLQPNPAHDELAMVITAPAAGSVDISLLDVTGKKVNAFTLPCYKGANAPVQFNVSSMPAGMYLVRASSVWGVQQLKFVKY